MITELYTKKEAAEMLKISEVTLSRLVADGKINSTKIGRRRMFTEKHINRMILDGEA